LRGARVGSGGVARCRSGGSSGGVVADENSRGGLRHAWAVLDHAAEAPWPACTVALLASSRTKHWEVKGMPIGCLAKPDQGLTGGLSKPGLSPPTTNQTSQFWLQGTRPRFRHLIKHITYINHNLFWSITAGILKPVMIELSLRIRKTMDICQQRWRSISNKERE
jgi:hypothetical protein